MLKKKKELVSDLLLWTPAHGSRRPGRPLKNYIDQLAADSQQHIEELPQALTDRHVWKRIVGQIRASSMQQVSIAT